MSLYRKWLVHRYGSSYRHTGAAKRNIALTVICAVIVLLYSILIVVMACVQNPTEKNTALFSATVADADYSILSSSALEIRTEEHPFCAFMVRPPVSELVQAGDAPRLQPGDNITFRVRNAEAPFLQEEGQEVEVVSLKTETQTLFALSDYSRINRETWAQPVIAGGVLVVLSAAGLVFSLRRRKRLKSEGRYYKNETVCQ